MGTQKRRDVQIEDTHPDFSDSHAGCNARMNRDSALMEKLFDDHSLDIALEKMPEMRSSEHIIHRLRIS